MIRPKVTWNLTWSAQWKLLNVFSIFENEGQHYKKKMKKIKFYTAFWFTSKQFPLFSKLLRKKIENILGTMFKMNFLCYLLLTMIYLFACAWRHYWFYQTPDISANTTEGVKQGKLVRLQLPLTECWGQCYDGASNMLGKNPLLLPDLRKNS